MRPLNAFVSVLSVALLGLYVVRLLDGSNAGVRLAAAQGTKALTPSSVQRMSILVSDGVSTVDAVLQLSALRATRRGKAGSSSAAVPFEALGGLIAKLRSSMQRLHLRLGQLFTKGVSAELAQALADLRSLGSEEGRSVLNDALPMVSAWSQSCPNTEAARTVRGPLYAQFGRLKLNKEAVESELRELADAIIPLREEVARLEGEAQGLQSTLPAAKGAAANQSATSGHAGLDYELSRYLSVELLRWNLLRTKVAHHLAVQITESRKRATAKWAGSPADAREQALVGAKERLSAAEARLSELAASHKKLAEERKGMGEKMRAHLKSMVLACHEEADAATAAPTYGTAEPLINKRFKNIKRDYAVEIQATEEMAIFLNQTLYRSLPQSLDLLEGILEPYRVGLPVAGMRGGAPPASDTYHYRLPETWNTKPRIGKWWEWLQPKAGEGGGRVRDLAEFEKQFERAQKRFEVKISSGEPVVMGYLYWLLSDELLNDGQDEILTLPKPEDIKPAAAAAPTSEPQQVVNVV